MIYAIAGGGVLMLIAESLRTATAPWILIARAALHPQACWINLVHHAWPAFWRAWRDNYRWSYDEARRMLVREAA